MRIGNILGTIFAVIFSIVGIYLEVFDSPYGQRLEYGNSELLYEEPVTEELARRIGDALVRADWFDDEIESSVQVQQDADGLQLNFVIMDDYQSKIWLIEQVRIKGGEVALIADWTKGLTVGIADDELNVKSTHTSLHLLEQEKSQIYIPRGLKEDGERMLAFAKERGLTEKAQVMLMDRDDKGYLVKVRLTEDAFRSPYIETEYQGMRDVLQAELFANSPMQFYLTDEYWDTQKELKKLTNATVAH